MRKILVTAISGNVSNGILKILNHTEDNIYGCDINDYPVGMDKVENYWKSEPAVAPSYIDGLLEKCSEYGITHLIPVNESEIKVISENREKFKKNNIKVVINDTFIVNTFLNKYATFQYLNNIEGICVPKTYQYSEFHEEGKEYIVKLNHSCGSKYFEIVRSKDEAEALSLKDDEYVIQEYLKNSNEEYTVGVFSDGNKVHVITFKRKLQHGYTSFVELVQDEEIEKEAKIIAEKINLKGCINIQLRKQDGKNYIFEINPRISGTVYFRYMLGFNDVMWWLDLLDGRLDPQYVCQYRTAIGMRELSEKFVLLH